MFVASFLVSLMLMVMEEDHRVKVGAYQGHSVYVKSAGW